MKMDLEKPIFTYYLNVAGMTRQRAEEQITKLMENFDKMGLQIVLVFVENKDSELSCIWKGTSVEKKSDASEEFQKLLDETLKIMDILSVSNHFGEFTQRLREYKLDKLEE